MYLKKLKHELRIKSNDKTTGLFGCFVLLRNFNICFIAYQAFLYLLRTNLAFELTVSFELIILKIVFNLL